MSETRARRPAQRAIANAVAATETVEDPVVRAAEETAATEALALPPPPANPPVGAAGMFAAFEAAQAALMRGAEALADEWAAMARSEAAAAAGAALALIGARTLYDALDVNAGFARRSFEAAVAGSARLSEIGIRCAAETIDPRPGSRF